MSENIQPEDCDLLIKIEELRSSFTDAHWEFGRLTQIFCVRRLQDKAIAESEFYLWYIAFVQDKVSRLAARRFDESQRIGTPSAILRSSFHLYMEAVTLRMLSIYKEFSEISRMAEIPDVLWPWWQTRAMIGSEAHRVKAWVRQLWEVHPNAADFDGIAPWSESPELIFFFEKLSYITKFERQFKTIYCDGLNSQLLKASLHESTESKKRLSQLAPLSENPPRDLPAVSADLNRPPVNAWREARKFETQKKRDRWQRKREVLAIEYPEMTDSYMSKKIAKSEPGISAETIRKNMR